MPETQTQYYSFCLIINDDAMKIIKIPFEYRITSIYIVLGALWILFSDQLMSGFTTNSDQILLISTYKGWFYVLITGILLFSLIRKEISARNELYNKLLIANKKAVESERLKTAFLSNISHYIRTPMNSILGFVDLLETQNLDEDKRKLFMSVINDQSQYLLQLLSNIIDIAKLQEGQMAVASKPFSISNMCHRLQTVYEFEISKKKAIQSIDFIPDLTEHSDTIISDQQKIQSILSNLINNAVKHSKGSKIEFGYNIVENNVVCFVSDTGLGIVEEKLNYILSGNMFTNTTYMEANEGMGLGLYLSFRLANLLGGKLWIEYSGSKGTKICFNFSYKPTN